MKRALIAVLLGLALTLTMQPAHSAATAAAASILGYTGTAARHPATLNAGQSAGLSVTVRPGDTYGRWAVRFCGHFAAWPIIAKANGWPERAIPIGAIAVIPCQHNQETTPSAPISTQTAVWVHPLASGKRGGSCYGWRASTNSFHGGVDMAQPWGTTIRAVTAGTVYLKAFERKGAGYYVLLKHPGGIYTLYAHMPSPSPLAIGAAVVAGQTIGRVGATGNATGPHLHYEVRLGGPSSSNRINPAGFMRSHGINIGC